MSLNCPGYFSLARKEIQAASQSVVFKKKNVMAPFCPLSSGSYSLAL
jgi:hypothetical protein